MVSIAEAFATIRPDFSKFDAETQAGLQKSLNAITGSLLGAGAALTAGLTAPIVGVGAAALKSSMTFESAFAGVVKTVDATAGELDILRTGILDLSKDLPASAASIADVAMSAGQLGIQVPNILDFTRVMVDLGEATNLTATDAAQALARFANITQMSQQDFDRLGSAVVALGNNLATTEAEIVQFALRIAGAGSQIGLSEDQILAWGAALSSVGVEAEAGGTAISRVFVDIANAVASGGPEVAKFAQVADMSVREFSQSFREDASSAVMTFIEGLGDLRQSGANVFAVLENLGLAEVRVRDALLRASGAGNLLRQSLDLSAEGWEQNIALTREAELRYGTAESRLAMLRNQFQAAAITLGDALVPMMLRLVDLVSALTPYIEGAARVFAELPGPIQVGAVALAALAAAIGPVLLLAGGMAAGFSALVPVIGAATAALTGFNVAVLANPVTAGLLVAGLAAGAVAAKLFGDAMKDANEELARSIRISEQSKAQTQEYIFDLQRREQLIREEIAALEQDADGWVLFNGYLQSTQVVSGYLQAELKGVTEELSAQEAALLQFAKQEKLTAEQTDALRKLMDEFGGSAIGAANDLAQLTPQMVATGVAARVMKLWMSETLPPMVGMALGMKTLVEGIQQVQQVAEMQAGLNGL
ncbi:MAG: phage tail tape measure protein, partial [Dehalococcoidia bacterium]|nr:phage tail tape measure protein [Dehalococcoidia bacterium]